MGGRSYECPDCGKWFLEPGCIRSHIKAKHPERVIPSPIPVGPKGAWEDMKKPHEKTKEKLWKEIEVLSNRIHKLNWKKEGLIEQWKNIK